MRGRAVALTTGMRSSSGERFAIVARTQHDLRKPCGRIAEALRCASRRKLLQASAVSGVFSDGFQSTVSPQTSASAEIPAPDGDREVEGGDHADETERMPLLHHAMAGTLRCDREAVELARKTDREIADIDHLLHFAETFLQNLAGFKVRQRLPRASLSSRNSSPKRRISSPRRGAGTWRHTSNARTLAAILTPIGVCRRSGCARSRCRRSANGPRARPADVDHTEFGGCRRTFFLLQTRTQQEPVHGPQEIGHPVAPERAGELHLRCCLSQISARHATAVSPPAIQGPAGWTPTGEGPPASHPTFVRRFRSSQASSWAQCVGIDANMDKRGRIRASASSNAPEIRRSIDEKPSHHRPARAPQNRGFSRSVPMVCPGYSRS